MNCTRLPLQRMTTLRPECLRQLVCRNYRTVWDRLCPVAHCRLIKETPRSFAWPRRGSKWTKLSDKHFKECPRERDELFNRAKKRASWCEIKPRMPRGCATQCHPNNVPAGTPKQFWHRTTVFFSTFFLTEISKWKLNNWYGRSKDDFFLLWKVKSIAVVMARSKRQKSVYLVLLLLTHQ